MMKKGLHTLLLISGVGALYPVAALAHTGIGLASGFGHGLAHPLLGLDHLLAMVAVGLLAVQAGGKAIWALPATFVSAMLLGGGLAIAGVHIPFVEAGILASVLVLGALVAVALRFPLMLDVLLVGVFALFHGHAHGAEMPLASGALSYSMGFALMTALLHGMGVAGAVLMKRFDMEKTLRLAGGAIAIAGAWMAIA